MLTRTAWGRQMASWDRPLVPSGRAPANVHAEQEGQHPDCRLRAGRGHVLTHPGTRHSEDTGVGKVTSGKRLFPEGQVGLQPVPQPWQRGPEDSGTPATHWQGTARALGSGKCGNAGKFPKAKLPITGSGRTGTLTQVHTGREGSVTL